MLRDRKSTRFRKILRPAWCATHFRAAPCSHRALACDMINEDKSRLFFTACNVRRAADATQGIRTLERWHVWVMPMHKARSEECESRRTRSHPLPAYFMSCLFLAFAFPLPLLICLVAQLLPQQVAAYASLNERGGVTRSPRHGISLRLMKSKTIGQGIQRSERYGGSITRCYKHQHQRTASASFSHCSSAAPHSSHR